MGPFIFDEDGVMTTDPTYLQPGPLTALGTHRRQATGLPDREASVTEAVQQLLIHEHMAALYDVELDDVARQTVHLRPVEQILDAAMSLSGAPLGVARPPRHRAAGNCRHYSVVTVALLRANAIAARARCGFGGYFGTGAHEDHWVVERRLPDGSWRLLDAQIDPVQQAAFALRFDPFDVPRDQFLVAGEAWRKCRRGEADADTFGLTLLQETGLWWIAANMIRDAAALVGVEMLPWDVWGAMPTPDEPIAEDHLELFDQLAELTIEPDGNLASIDALMTNDPRLRVPDLVFNALRERQEAWLAGPSDR